MAEQISFWNRTFWDLWLQKIFRNFASMKFQWLMLLYIPTIWGMFHIPEGSKEPWISATIGFTFLGGGFITFAITRIIAQTRLIEDGDIDSLLDKDARIFNKGINIRLDKEKNVTLDTDK